MAKLLGTEVNGHRIDRYWLHSGDDGKDRITVQTTEDVEPILDANKRDFTHGSRFVRRSEGPRLVARIPGTVLEEMCRIHKIKFRELMANQTDLAQRIWNVLLNGSDFRHLQTTSDHIVIKAAREVS